MTWSYNCSVLACGDFGQFSVNTKQDNSLACNTCMVFHLVSWERGQLYRYSVLWEPRLELQSWDPKQILPPFPLNPLVTESAGLWSTDQGSDTTHLSLTWRFRPATMWCKWKWKRTPTHLLVPWQSYDIRFAMTKRYYHLCSPAGHFTPQSDGLIEAGGDVFLKVGVGACVCR